MFSLIDTREAQVQPMEKHSDPVKRYQVLSGHHQVLPSVNQQEPASQKLWLPRATRQPL